jgi:hypothetical protein
MFDLDARENLVAYGAGARVEVADISQPNFPEVVGATRPLDEVVTSVRLEGQHVFAVTYAAFHAIDIADPSQPVVVAEVASSDGTSLDSFAGLEYGYAYIRAWVDQRSVILVYDVAEPNTPTEVGRYVFSYESGGMEVTGGYAYVAEVGDGGLHIYDVADPDAIEEVGFVAIGGTSRRLDVVGGAAFLATQDKRVVAIDISEPSNPLAVSELPVRANAESVDGLAGRLYVSTLGADSEEPPATTVEVFDISEPATAHLLGRSVLLGIHGIQRLVPCGRHACGATGIGLAIIDTADPATMYAIGNISWASPLRILIAGPTLYAVDRKAGFWSADITDPAAPIWLNRLDDTEYGPRDGVLYGDSAYLTYELDDPGLRVVDVGNSSNLTPMGWVEGYAWNLALSGNALLATTVDGRFRTFSLAEAESPVELASIPLGDPFEWFSFELQADGGRAYAPDEELGVLVVDVADPAAPRLVGAARSGLRVSSGQGEGDLLYLTARPTGLHVFDVAVPWDPVELSATEWPDLWLHKIVVDRGLAYICATRRDFTGPERIELVDISDPTEPVKLGGIDVPIAVRVYPVPGSDIVYVAGDLGGTTVLRRLADIPRTPQVTRTPLPTRVLTASPVATTTPSGTPTRIATIGPSPSLSPAAVSPAAVSPTPRPTTMPAYLPIGLNRPDGAAP